MVIAILLRNLRQDLARYNRLATDEEKAVYETSLAHENAALKRLNTAHGEKAKAYERQSSRKVASGN